MKDSGISNAVDLVDMQARIRAKMQKETQQIPVKVSSIQQCAAEVKVTSVVRESRERPEVVEKAPESLAEGWLKGLC